MKSIVRRHKKTSVKTTRKNKTHKTHKKKSIKRSNKYRRMRSKSRSKEELAKKEYIKEEITM